MWCLQPTEPPLNYVSLMGVSISCDCFSSILTFKLDKKFKQACLDARFFKSNLPDEEHLELYGLYKRSLYGRCKPNTVVDSYEKRECWSKYNNITTNEAKLRYVNLVKSLKKKYMLDESNFSSISKMAANDCFDENDKDPFNIISYGRLDKLEKLYNEDPEILYATGDNGMTLLHFAADRDMVEIAIFLVEKKLCINVRDDFGDTPLDSANAANSYNCIDFLLSNGGMTNNELNNRM